MLSVLSLSLIGCATNNLAPRERKELNRTYVTLPDNTKLLQASWANNDLSYICVSMTSNDVAKTTIYREPNGMASLNRIAIFWEKKTK
jgi:hypothetical protein